MEELNLQSYHSHKLTLQTVRSLHAKSTEVRRKQDLPWKVLEHIILMNSHCRESSIYEFMKTTSKQNIFTKVFRQAQETKSSEMLPHPMDMILLLFICSDFMLRQVLASKLFMCQLAIPFIVPDPDDKLEMLLWPLRSIVLEWQNQEHEAMEEALVKCKLHMVAFMRYGKSSFSKSKMLNAILSPSGHNVFFHKEAPCGRQKRLISNGTVELSHYLPSGGPQDRFKEPALFLNLRGDARDYQKQQHVMMDLASILVVILDVKEVHMNTADEMLQIINKKAKKIILVLTNTTGLSEHDIAQTGERLLNLIGRDAVDDTFIPTFEGSGPRNDADLTQHIISAIRNKVSGSPKQALEDFEKSSNSYTVDEIMNSRCRNGKTIADGILSDMLKIRGDERKRQLLPLQGEKLHEIRKCERDLHRNSSKDEALSDKEKIKIKMTELKKHQLKLSQANMFIRKLTSVFDNDINTQAFALRWLRLGLDAVSRLELPELHSDKNKKCYLFLKARTEDSPKLDSLEQDFHQAEMKIRAATCGLEHLMREMAQMYDVAMHVNRNEENLSKSLFYLSDIAARLLLAGHPTELMDGDHGVLPLVWIKSVFNSVVKLIGKNKKLFVLSILGIQSSGKSTLLNTMFGLEFAVSAGRCTRGIYAQLLPVTEGSNLPFDYMLALDSEGLRSQGVSHTLEHDNELATLIIGIADLTLINIKGESMAEVKDILQIAVHALLRMNQADSPHRRQCMFIHQNVSAANVQTKLATDRQELQDQLDRMTKEASEALGLPETITSFSRIIDFDCQRDVVYFSDMWHGDPPMASINQGYSTRAASTRETIMEQVVSHFPGCITMSEFPQRVEDMWRGVLADDFIFSFRNNLAAKAYIGVEQEFSRLTLEVMENLSGWVNRSCNIKIQNCSSEHDLDTCIEDFHVSLEQKVADLHTEKLESLKKYFSTATSRDIIIQWKTEKETSLKLFCEAEKRQTHKQLDNMKTRQVFKIHQQSAFHIHDQKIMKQAIRLAEDLRGKSPTDKELREEFDKIWNPFERQLESDFSLLSSDILSDLRGILGDVMSSLGWEKYLHEQYKVTQLHPNASLNTISQQDISKDHIVTRGKSVRMAQMKAFMVDSAVRLGNDMMDAVTKKVQEICEQDVMFEKLDGVQTINLAVENVRKHNDNEKKKFAFSPQFIAFFVVRVACYAAAHFQKMNTRFEERHGARTKLKDYRSRLFLLFQNTVQEKSAELVLAANFCESIKGTLLEFVRIKVDESVGKEIHQNIGSSKYDLITKMLDEFLQKRSFTELLDYVNHPYESATAWMQGFGNNLIFGKTCGKTLYSKFANICVDEIIAEVRSSAEAASREARSTTGDQHNTWIRIFCEQMTNTAPIDPRNLEVATKYKIGTVDHYQEALEQRLQKLEKDMKDKFLQITAETVQWADIKSPFQKACDRLWGCTALCPFCYEPCQHSDPNHEVSHRCIQHRPPGIRGVHWENSKELLIKTCNFEISTSAVYRCSVIGNQCRKTPHCDTTGDEYVHHPYMEYKKFLPGWDIAPDPAGDASKYWQWVMHTFQEELVEIYNDLKLEIPASWKDTTEKEAIESLRIYFQ